MKYVGLTKKISFRHILYATDFSAASEAALPLVKEIARHYDSTVIGAHICKPESYALGLAPPESWTILEKAWQLQGLAKAERLQDKLQGITSKVIIREGDPGEELAAIMRDCEIDLLVIGTRGRIGIEKALLGSVAERVLRQTSCPVITVGPENTTGSRPFKIDRILFATDFSSGSAVAAPYAISLAEENEAELDILHVLSKEGGDDLRYVGDFAARWIQRLKQIVPHDAGLVCRPEYLVQIGDPAERILEIGRSRHANLIVLGARYVPNYSAASTHISWSIAHEVIAHASCPVLTVRG